MIRSHHPHPEELLARLTREMDTNLRELNTNPLHRRPRARKSELLRNLAILFLFGFLLTCGLLVLAGVEGR